MQPIIFIIESKKITIYPNKILLSLFILIYNIYTLIYNTYYKSILILQYLSLVYKLRNWSKYTKITVIERFYRMQQYKNKEKLKLKNMKILERISTKTNIPISSLCEKYKPYNYHKLNYMAIMLQNNFL